MRDSYILIVDDDDLTLQALRRMLNSEAHIISVESATAALAEIEKREFAVVMTDLVMPGMNGFELIKELQVRSPASVCVVLTGQIDEPFGCRLPENVLTCLHKPVSIDEIVRVLHSALGDYVLRTTTAQVCPRK